jgi:hypothetical protein
MGALAKARCTQAMNYIDFDCAVSIGEIEENFPRSPWLPQIALPLKSSSRLLSDDENRKFGCLRERLF